MTEREAHLRGIALDRFNRLPRLVFADWLDEQQEPSDSLFAEFIRVSCQLADLTRIHPLATWCDCERCRLGRRKCELFDQGSCSNVFWWRSSTIQPVGPQLNDYEEGFPATYRMSHQNLLVQDISIPLRISRVFLNLPVREVLVDFIARPSRPRNRGDITWRLGITTSIPSDGVPVVSGRIGPIVNRVDHTTFECMYSVSDLKRIPTLARKAAYRCMTNRISNSEGRVPRRCPIHDTGSLRRSVT